jgi:hypothetical protein
MGINILYIAIPLASVIAAPFLRHAFEMRKENKYREMFGSVFWAAIPFGVSSLLWARTGPVMFAQNLTLGLLGAVIGACALIWIGYVVRGPEAQTQTTTGGTQPQVSISGGDNVVSIGQIRGITAKIVTINPPLKPELRIIEKSEINNSDGTHTVTIKTEVSSPITPGLLAIQIDAVGICNVRIVPPPTDGFSAIQLRNVRRDQNSYSAEIPSPRGIGQVRAAKRKASICGSPCSTPRTINHASWTGFTKTVISLVGPERPSDCGSPTSLAISGQRSS